MKLNWRNRGYKFEVTTLQAGKDKDRQSDIDANIYAFDTESVDTGTRYEPMTFQFSSTNSDELIYLEPNANALEVFLDYFVKNFSWIEFQNKCCFIYGHNLVYDLCQLIKNYPDLLAIVRAGIGLETDYMIYEKDYYCKLKKGGLFQGTAPHFSIEVGFSKREKVEIKFRDCFAFFPASLDSLGEQLGLAEKKLERQEDIGKRDYRLEGESENKAYFEKYAKLDAKVTRLVAEQIRDLHRHAGMKRIRVSAPGFAINYLLHNMRPGTSLVTGTEDTSIMQLVLDTYAGGRTGGIFHGHVEDISVMDFHSSYPTSMTCLPSFTPDMEYMRYEDCENLTIPDFMGILKEYHAFIRISGIEHDSEYPALIQNVNNKLTPVYGEFNNIATTGIEAYCGVMSGSLEITKIHELVILVDETDYKPFADFANSAYDRKATAEKNSPEYNSAKLVLNSAYGKLIESRRETFIQDTEANVIVPVLEGQEKEYTDMYYLEYVDCLRFGANFEERISNIYQELLPTLEDGEEFIFTNFGGLNLTPLVYGRYAIPAAASLITGISRARLYCVIKGTKSMYWDTDSAFKHKLDKAKINAQLEHINKWIPDYCVGFSVGENLGELDIEIENASGFLAGTKRYYLENEVHSNCQDKTKCKDCKLFKKECKEKKAVHGMPTADKRQAETMIKNLATGLNNPYTGKARPLSAKQTKDSNLIGKFESKKYESLFHLDDRLEWTETPEGWKGTIKNFTEV